ncbi:hypothetical protein GCM10023221_04800 [Luteimicrobium xylanilyticum]|uniref:Activating signal cointegrator 1 complex subunit 2 like protein n=1 Tax=Luteimicrobium xylanilyticum TaxID=1133546 RepID=A0A5P9Q732_9MICO|nr:trypsin-like peptidase domain-containing protein [Luteimicrobium xylanilyticum]QFU97228.1 Activating signal cointegrator 1 complex subunit 2 like protein [Luteimicrobium xylanilyticum]
MSQPTNDENQDGQQVPQDAQAQQPAQPAPSQPSTPSAPTTPAQAARADEVPAQPAPQEHATQQLPRLVPPAPQPPAQAAAQQPAQPQQPRYGAYAPQPTQQPGAQQPQQHPYGQQAPQGHYGQPAQPTHDPYAGASFGLPPQPPSGNENPAKTTTKSRTWVPVAIAAVVAAVLAAGGTAVAVNALDDNNATSTSIASIGQQSSGDETVPVSGSTSQNPNWEAVTSTVSKSVVAISVTLSNGEAEGSGVILNKDGDVLTNNHVVSGAQSVQVTLADGRIFKAKIVGTDSSTDLAVVKLQDAPDDLSPATLGDSSKVTTGEAVLAVGNPLGLANTATTGIVSALNRPVSTSSSDSSGSGSSDSVVTNAIQIDAAINPGNSGGPLFNAEGQVIGITSSIATLSSNSLGGDSESGSIGLGFAIPVNLAKNISSQLIKSGTAEHAFLGVTLTDSTATADGVTRQGAKVNDVTSGSPADKAGIESGDVIVAIDGVASPGAESLTGFVRAHAAGDVVKLTIVRDGKAVDKSVTLAVKQETQSSSSSGSSGGQSGEQGQGDQNGQQGDGSGSGSGSGQDDNPFGDFFGGQG